MPSKLHCTAVYIKVRCQKSLDRLCNGSGYLEIVDKSRLHRPLNHRAIGSRFRTVHDGHGFVRFTTVTVSYGAWRFLHGLVSKVLPLLITWFGCSTHVGTVLSCTHLSHYYPSTCTRTRINCRLSGTDIHCTLYTLEYVVLHVCNFILISVFAKVRF